MSSVRSFPVTVDNNTDVHVNPSCLTTVSPSSTTVSSFNVCFVFVPLLKIQFHTAAKTTKRVVLSKVQLKVLNMFVKSTVKIILNECD